MEEQPVEEQITLQSGDGQEFVVSKNVANMSVTIKNLIEGNMI